MSDPVATRRFPRAGIDPVATPTAAHHLVDAVRARPPRHETVCVLLDQRRSGVGIVSVDGTVEPDSVLDVVDLVVMTAVADDRVDACVVASIRPGGSDDLDDLERWSEMSIRLEEAGVELVEWFVLGTGVSCPRALLGEPSRWPG